MMSPCQNCPKSDNCVTPCADLERLIPKDIELDLLSKYRDEIPVSRTKTAAKIEREKSRAKATLADIEKTIARGALYIANTDQEAILDEKETIRGKAEQNESVSDADVLKKIKECINNVVHDTKLNRRYRKYLGCDKMTAIARRAGVTKQTIQKQFARITNRISAMYEKRYDEAISNIPFKLKKAGGACRIELKK